MLPTIHGSLTLATLGTKPEGLKVGVINNELHNWTTECESPKHHGNSCDFSALSCKFLNFAREDNLLNLVSAVVVLQPKSFCVYEGITQFLILTII